MTTPSAQPPIASRIPAKRFHHGDTVMDDYAWLAEKTNPDVLAYLRAENAYTDASLESLASLRETIFEEIKGRTQQTDLSVPVRKGGWWYYSRTVEGQQYSIHCRLAAGPDEVTPPIPAGGQPLAGEEILLDGNELAAGHDFFSLGSFTVSPDATRLAYSTDFSGDERFALRIKDLRTGELLADEIPETAYSVAWSLDGSAIFYTTVDEAWRPNRAWRHVVGTPVADDAVVFEEPDERFWVRLGLTRSERYIVVRSASVLTSEVWLIDAADPAGEPRLVTERRNGVDYRVDHQGEDEGRLLILHNDNALNFELAQASVAEPANWQPLIAHREDTRLITVDSFASHFTVWYRRDGLTGIAVYRGDVEPAELSFPEPLYTVSPSQTPDYRSPVLRLQYESLITPRSVYDCDVATGELTLLKRRPVLTLPGEAPYRPEDYTEHREWAVASDGTRVPISLVCPKGTPLDGSAPCLLYGYGSYEMPTDPFFSIYHLSLLTRGFVFAIAHIRGGGEMGRQWYEDGKLLHKKNTFTDFVACAEHLVQRGWTSPGRLVARGGSAGGLLMGAVVNLAPEAMTGIVAQVPFVDALNSILDPSLPLTVTEWEEWGDPLHNPEVYFYMKGYSPYENVTAKRYPAILATTGLNDTRVLYHEPAKWMARLRAVAQGGPFLLRTEMEAGHGGRSGRYDAWKEEALILAWIIQTATAGAA
jgi:oligopeptidase B